MCDVCCGVAELRRRPTYITCSCRGNTHPFRRSLVCTSTCTCRISIKNLIHQAPGNREFISAWLAWRWLQPCARPGRHSHTGARGTTRETPATHVAGDSRHVAGWWQTFALSASAAPSRLQRRQRQSSPRLRACLGCRRCTCVMRCRSGLR